MEGLTRELKAVALTLGFDEVGVAEAGAADGTPTLRRWLDAGMHGGMDFMSRQAHLREDPRRVLDGCRSVVVVAMSYHSSHPPSWEGDGDGRAWVSRYAWGRDYHKILKKRLVHLGRWLSEQRADNRWRACVDTAPVAERAWAATAGLGWIGKNTQLISRGLGSELFLGTLLTTVELAPDPATTAHCGRCTACLDACPTGAFPEPGLLDARRCIAYLTVEHRGEVAPELAAAQGNMVAGCDICQEICPWNAKAPADLHEEFQPATARYRPRLAELGKLDEEEYRVWRRGSALNRIPFAHFERNLRLARMNEANSQDEGPPDD